jgi:hypothetical protein
LATGSIPNNKRSPGLAESALAYAAAGRGPFLFHLAGRNQQILASHAHILTSPMVSFRTLYNFLMRLPITVE